MHVALWGVVKGIMYQSIIMDTIINGKDLTNRIRFQKLFVKEW